jgi:NADH dehydrogenase [ubiquinone] 1 alpha subcomplex assembly factor 6
MLRKLGGRTSVDSERSRGPQRLSTVAAILRRHDRDRFQTALFAPAARREALFALYAFNYEIARVRETVTQPTLGHIRLEWWRETVAAAYDSGPARRHEIAEPLTAAIRDAGLGRAHFERLIEARAGDLEDDPPASLAALEEYAEATSAPLVHLALELLDAASAEAVAAGRDIGIGYALAGLLRALPYRIGVARPILPADLAAGHGLDPGDCARERDRPALRAVVASLAEAAERHLQAARARRALLPRAALPALLPAVIAANSLAGLRRNGFDPFAPALALPDPLQGWRLAVAMLLRRF